MLVLGVLGVFSHVACALFAEEKLVKKLFADSEYDRVARPALNPEEPVTVEVQFYLKAVDDLDAKKQYLQTNGYIGFRWVDPRLVWNKSEHGGIYKIVVYPTMIWLPDVVLANSISGVYEDAYYKHIRATVWDDGSVEWEPGGTFTSTCTIDIRFFPFDDQVCNLIFGNWAYTADQVNLTSGSDSVNLKSYKGNVEWSIVETVAFRDDVFYSSWADPFPIIYCHVHFRRKPLYYIVNIIFPSGMLSVLVVLLFWLPADSGEKISLGVTIVLAFSVLLLMVAENVPKTSVAIPVIVIYLMFFMATSTLALVLSVLVLHLHHHSGDRQPPLWLRRLVLGYLAKVILCSNMVMDGLLEHTITGKKDDQYHSANTRNERNSEDLQDKQLEHTSKVKQEHQKNRNERNSEDFSGILGSLKEMSTRQVGEKKQQMRAEQWKMISSVLDRFFFWVFCVLLLIISPVILVYLPLTKPNINLRNHTM